VAVVVVLLLAVVFAVAVAVVLVLALAVVFAVAVARNVSSCAITAKSCITSEFGGKSWEIKCIGNKRFFDYTAKIDNSKKFGGK